MRGLTCSLDSFSIAIIEYCVSKEAEPPSSSLEKLNPASLNFSTATRTLAGAEPLSPWKRAPAKRLIA
ncbi:Uncharacterised protein [Chlamydia trachomatis]|nr:Uncharacterised protein [Chlamydia trachomatis]CRH48930.1 Uncharacterised protein [Chlamydia trachomatis]